jgi:leishmanolysin
MTGFRYIVVILVLLAGQAYSCIHDELDITLSEVPVEDVHDHRMLAVVYGSIRIMFDYSNLNNVPAATKTYLQTKLIPAALNYFTNTIQVPPVASIKIPASQTTICGLPYPAVYSTGVAADLVIFVTGGTDTGSYLAWAKACLLHATTKRPIFGQIYFNYNEIVPNGDIEFENDLITTIHELTHVLGFSSSLYQYYPSNPTVTIKNVNGNNVTVLGMEPLTSKLRTYFNCPTLEGAYLENEGEAASAGSHFERRIFNVEYMTASAVTDARMTEFTLALLEGTGWYQVSYAMAEPIYWGKGQGCAFLNSPCVTSSKTAAFEEFCTPLAQGGCSFHGRSGGYCGAVSTATTDSTLEPQFNYFGNKTIVSDTFADNCPYIRPYSNEDCQNPVYQSNSLLSTEVYGSGSMCFMGTLYPTGTLKTKTSYCLQYTCEKQTAGNFFLRIVFGTNSALCKSLGSISVTGYYGKVDCPDPDDYCTTIGAKFCKRGCMGKGTCNTVTGKCTCQTGWRGADCGIAV